MDSKNLDHKFDIVGFFCAIFNNIKFDNRKFGKLHRY